MFSLTGKVAFVTGAGQGMGAGIAEALAEAGAIVIMTGRGDNVYRTAEKIGNNAVPMHLDVTDEKEIKKVSEDVLNKYGHLDILVNNAGIMRTVDAKTMDNEPFEKNMRTNVFGTWNVTKAFLPSMMERKYGRIINQSSVTGPLVVDSGMMAYAPTKGALLAFTKALAIEGAPYGITANAIMPGYIRTNMTQITAMNLDSSNPEAFYEKVSSGIPLGRFGTPKEVGYLVAFLASDEAGYITGAEVVIDGAARLPETIAMTGPYTPVKITI